MHCNRPTEVNDFWHIYLATEKVATDECAATDWQTNSTKRVTAGSRDLQTLQISQRGKFGQWLVKLVAQVQFLQRNRQVDIVQWLIEVVAQMKVHKPARKLDIVQWLIQNDTVVAK